MLSVLNNIRVQGPADSRPRPLTEEERAKAQTAFYRKSKPQFDFDDVAKAIAGRGKYQTLGDDGDRPYRFNYRLEQSLSGCPTIAALRALFGPDYQAEIARRTVSPRPKTPEQAVADVWNVLYSFPDRSHVEAWGRTHLSLTREEAKTFADIPLSHTFASLSLCALRRIVPWLRRGLIYPHAVLMAKVPDIVGADVWQQRGEEITDELETLLHHARDNKDDQLPTMEFCIKDYLSNNFPSCIPRLGTLYHPSMIDPYPAAKPNAQGVPQLGSPQTDAVRNPMAMRSLHEIRRVVNALLRRGLITSRTILHVEYARELNDANRRTALARWNKQREQQRAKYAEEIRALGVEPTDSDILRMELWREQDEHCLYTGQKISLKDIIGENPNYDIEHTIPRSAGGDFTHENLTLCSSRYNREVKRTLLPVQLPNHDDILARLAPWRERIAQLQKDIDKIRTYADMDKGVKDALIQKRHLKRIELDYYRGKYRRFEMTEVPEGFARRQGAGIGLVGKYAGLYLRSLFHTSDEKARSNVRVVKGAMTAEFRRLWGVQDEYEKKSRDRHTHHTIDAIVIACIGMAEHSQMAKWYHADEEGRGQKPDIKKPWLSFVPDMQRVAEDTLVVHDTPDRLARRARRHVKTPTGTHLSQGDSARASLHCDTYYGAIMHEGEVQYVVRRRLADMAQNPKLVDKIVDEAVKAAVKAAIQERGLKDALAGPIYLNKEKGVEIKKVRCYAHVTNPLHIGHQRDVSTKEYKRQYHVTTDGTYCIAVYEGLRKGKTVRECNVVNMLSAAALLKESAGGQRVVPEEQNGLPLKYILKRGTQVIMLQHEGEQIDVADQSTVAKRLYHVTIIEGIGRITLLHNREARKNDALGTGNATPYVEGAEYRPKIYIRFRNLHALVEGVDFTLDVLGNITLKP